jgi:hypothetical protein
MHLQGRGRRPYRDYAATDPSAAGFTRSFPTDPDSVPACR